MPDKKQRTRPQYKTVLDVPVPSIITVRRHFGVDEVDEAPFIAYPFFFEVDEAPPMLLSLV